MPNCDSGFFHDKFLDTCRECKLVCADEYGGPNSVECIRSCPGYGDTTLPASSTFPASSTLPASSSLLASSTLPAFSTTPSPGGVDTDMILVIVLLFSLLLLLGVIILCWKKRRCFKKPAEKLFVTQESQDELNDVQSSLQPKNIVTEETAQGHNGASSMCV